MAQPRLQTHTHYRSREAKCPPRFAKPPSQKRGERSADRRSGAAAPVGGRVTYARRRQRAPCVPWRDARLSALHRGGCWPGPARDEARRLHRLRAPRVRS
jgi:hypothetical protein